MPWHAISAQECGGVSDNPFALHLLECSSSKILRVGVEYPSSCSEAQRSRAGSHETHLDKGSDALEHALDGEACGRMRCYLCYHLSHTNQEGDASPIQSIMANEPKTAWVHVMESAELNDTIRGGSTKKLYYCILCIRGHLYLTILCEEAWSFTRKKSAYLLMCFCSCAVSVPASGRGRPGTIWSVRYIFCSFLDRNL
jgi:hypothetical protein